MLDTLVARGYDFDKLFSVYPWILVETMYKAVVQNRKIDLVWGSTAANMAVVDALVRIFNKGKSKVLAEYHDILLKDPEQNKKPVKTMSAKAAAFFGEGLSGVVPVVVKKSETGHV